MKPRSDKLGTYRHKRDFKITPEPAPRVKRSRKKSRLTFCVQKHLASQLHYDFRLEHEGVLLSWAVPKGPSLKPADKRMAIRTEDHPLNYGSFEGVIPSGYGAGIVLLWDKGTWKCERDDIGASLSKGELEFELDGVKLKGSWVLVRTRNEGKQEQWLLIKHRDEWAGSIDIAMFAPRSVKSFGDFDDILRDSGHLEQWKADPPVKTGETGRLFQEIIHRASLVASKKVEL